MARSMTAPVSSSDSQKRFSRRKDVRSGITSRLTKGGRVECIPRARMDEAMRVRVHRRASSKSTLEQNMRRSLRKTRGEGRSIVSSKGGKTFPTSATRLSLFRAQVWDVFPFSSEMGLSSWSRSEAINTEREKNGDRFSFRISFRNQLSCLTMPVMPPCARERRSIRSRRTMHALFSRHVWFSTRVTTRCHLSLATACRTCSLAPNESLTLCPLYSINSASRRSTAS